MSDTETKYTDNNPMLIHDIFTRFHGIENKVRDLINKSDDSNRKDVLISFELLVDIACLLEEGRYAKYEVEYLKRTHKKMNQILEKLDRIALNNGEDANDT